MAFYNCIQGYKEMSKSSLAVVYTVVNIVFV